MQNGIFFSILSVPSLPCSMLFRSQKCPSYRWGSWGSASSWEGETLEPPATTRPHHPPLRTSRVPALSVSGSFNKKAPLSPPPAYAFPPRNSRKKFLCVKIAVGNVAFCILGGSQVMLHRMFFWER